VKKKLCGLCVLRGCFPVAGPAESRHPNVAT
jgi:hypothetical protein